MRHVGLGEGGDLVIIAPGTEPHLAKLANGLADDMLTGTALNVHSPVIVAPAMDGDMYAHPAAVENIRRLQERGVTIIEPEEGRMASGAVGRGRLPEVPELIGVIRQQLGREWRQLRDRRVVVTSGGARGAIDP